jgi:hypothetical protein
MAKKVNCASLSSPRDSSLKGAIKQTLGTLPLTAELYWQLSLQGKPPSKSISLGHSQKHLAEMVAQATDARRIATQVPQRVLLFVTLRYWIEHAVPLAFALAGLGHEVTLAFLPYASWRKPLNRFDLRLYNAYTLSVLKQAEPLIKIVSMLDHSASPDPLSAELQGAIEDISVRDIQYTLQVEDFDLTDVECHSLYRLRIGRNTQACQVAQRLFKSNRPQVVLTPNGSILEFGAVYQAARSLDIPVVTYEFGEQRGRIWLAHNREVMRQETDELWEARQDTPLNKEEWEQIRALFASRQRASLWENFSRRWQGLPSQGGEQVHQALGLDGRPVVLLAANVIGDSLTLGRQVFTSNMSSWLEQAVIDFARRPQVQLVVRIHPGERYTTGPSVADLIRRALPETPAHIHLVAADDPINTYDLVEIADLGLVYTTTVGLEMAMSGVPVIVVGQTHYRAKGFTLDPETWDAYMELLERAILNPSGTRLTRPQVERAWSYAYRFFFEFPCPFPWHLLYFGDELLDWPIQRVLSPEGEDLFGETFRYLAGGERRWSSLPSSLITSLPAIPDPGLVEGVFPGLSPTTIESDAVSEEREINYRPRLVEYE